MGLMAEVSGPPLAETSSERWIFDKLEDWARRAPGQPAFIVDHADRIEEYRYADVFRFMESVAAALDKIGIRRRDRVGILMENIPQWVFALLGTLRLGAVAVPLATALPENALRRILEHSGCRLIFADAPNAEKACNAASLLNLQVVAFDSDEPPALPSHPFLNSPPLPPPLPSAN